MCLGYHTFRKPSTIPLFAWMVDANQSGFAEINANGYY